MILFSITSQTNIHVNSKVLFCVAIELKPLFLALNMTNEKLITEFPSVFPFKLFPQYPRPQL